MFVFGGSYNVKESLREREREREKAREQRKRLSENETTQPLVEENKCTEHMYATRCSVDSCFILCSDSLRLSTRKRNHD